MTPFNLPATCRLIEAALEEDIGRGDRTTELTVPAETRAQARIMAKQDGVLAGLPIVAKTFQALGAEVKINAEQMDGESFRKGQVIAVVDGAARFLLTAERTILNFLQHLSGVATHTRRFVKAVAGTRARIADTRKTIPGLRVLEKYAVRMGGGLNHRFGLDDGVLIKDNHIVAAGGIVAAVERARAGVPHTIKIQVECATLAHVEEALAAGVDAILLDNMSVAMLRRAVKKIGGRVLVEASGGIDLDNVRAIAEAGVDLISVGAITHSAAAVDLSMKITQVGAEEKGARVVQHSKARFSRRLRQRRLT